MKPYPSYKDSDVEWIGRIPSHWDTKKIKYQFTIEKNQVSVSEFESNKVIHYSIPNVQECGKGQLENGEDIDSSKLLLNGNELLVSRLNPRKRTICICEPDMEHMILASGEFIVLVPNGINLKYCFYQLISDGMTKNLDSIVESVTKSHQRVRPEKVLNTQFIEPLKDEIEEIVSFLDNKTQKIDSLIKKTKKKIELLKEQRISLINHCVAKGLDPNVEMKDSGVEWIGEIPSGWEVRKLKYFSDVFSSSVDRHIYENELQVSICHYPDVYNNEFINENVELNKGSCSEVEFDRFHLKEGFVILTKDSESPDDIGIPCYVETNLNNVVCGYHLFVIIKNKNYINSKFLFRFIQSDIVRCHFEVNSKGITRFGLSKSIIENLFVDLPPIPEQQLIADYLDEQTQKIDTTIEKETQRIELLKEYRQSLISEVVTGKIDVRDEVVV